MAEAELTHFLSEAPMSDAVRRLFDGDVEDMGYVMNLTRVWAHQPEANEGLFSVLGAMTKAAGLTMRQRGVLVTACASALGDSYCSVAWGGRLADQTEPGTAAAVLGGRFDELEDQDRVLARWARKVASNPAATELSDVEELRRAGFDDAAIVAITIYVALRLAFSTVNNALGARPDRELWSGAPEQVTAAIGFGRPPSATRAET